MLEVLYIIKSTETGKIVYRTIDYTSGLIRDLDYNTVKQNGIKQSNAEAITVRDLEHYGGRVRKGINDFETWCRLNNALDMLAEYDLTQNPKKPSEISRGSIDKVMWKCKNGHYWSAIIKSRTAARCGCPYCAFEKGNYKMLVPGINDLETWCKENNRLDLLEEYSIENELYPNEIAFGNTSKPTKWICRKCNTEFSNRVENRTLKNQGCPACATNGSSVPEMTIYFYLSNYFSDVKYRTKIYGYEADVFLSKQGLVIDYQGDYWHLNRTDIDARKQQVFEKNGLAFIRIVQTLSAVPNGIDNNTIYFRGTNLEWMLQALSNMLGIDYNAELANNSYNEALAIRKSKKVINSIAETHPDVARRWDYEKNIGLTPENFTSGTSYKAWFICPNCGNSYYSFIRKQAIGQGCPICARYKTHKKTKEGDD